MTTVVWFRDDLRLADHPALFAAADDPGGVVCLYLFDDVTPGIRPPGGAARWWLHHSLQALAASLARHGVPLILRRGAAEAVIPEVVAQSGADGVVWNRRYGGAERDVDAALKQRLRSGGIRAESFPGGMLHEPWTISTGQGTAFRVYSAYWRACLRLPEPRHPIPTPPRLTPARVQPPSDELDAWGLRPTAPDWAAGLAHRWRPGEASASDALDRFLADRVDDYARERDMMAQDATSGLSAHLRWGEISPHTVWHRARASGRSSGRDVEAFLGELGWREFAWYTLFHRPDLAVRSIDPRFDAFPWQSADPELLRAWQTGTTGIPLVDAGMRELWRTGSMHNRVRMVTASFLTKNLLIDWRDGERWFWDTLVDADAASNPFNWQWVAGCGADAAPYFRVFNPVLQQQKFDADGEYVKRWAADSASLNPIVDVGESRRRALAAFDSIKRRPRGD